MGQCSYRDRKSLSYEGGIRCSPEDLGHTVGYARTQKCIQADGSEVTVRDPGDKLWGEVFDHLVQFWVYRRRAPADLPQLSDDRKGDLLELLLGAASILLDRGEQVQEASRHLRYCLHLIRLLVEDCARTLEEIHVASHPAGCLLKGQKDGHHVTSRHCPRCHQQVLPSGNMLPGRVPSVHSSTTSAACNNRPLQLALLAVRRRDPGEQILQPGALKQ